MTSTLTLAEGPADAELIATVRGGDLECYGELFARHVDSARRLARQLVPAGDVDDLVSDAFDKVLRVLQRGGGPDVAFRAYLLTALRRLHVDRLRASKRLHTTDDLEPFDPGVPFRDTVVEGFENEAAARAFVSLPERWQLVLWHTEVEGQKPAEIAPLLGMSPNSVAALAYRAREGLRQAFLTMHAQELDEDGCRWTHEHLGGYVRTALSRRDTGKVKAHLDECRRCTAVYLELTEVNSHLAALLAPALLGAAATGYLATATGAAVKGGFLMAGLDRLKDLVAANTSASVAAGVAATAVVAGTTFVAVGGIGQPQGTATNEQTGTAAVAPAPSAGTDRRPPRTPKVPDEKAVVPTAPAPPAPAPTAPVPSAPVPSAPAPGAPAPTSPAPGTPEPSSAPEPTASATPKPKPTTPPTAPPTTQPTLPPPVPTTPPEPEPEPEPEPRLATLQRPQMTAVNGCSTRGSITEPSSPGIVYTADPGWSATEGLVTVTARLQDGWTEFAADDSWQIDGSTATLTSDLGRYEMCDLTVTATSSPSPELARHVVTATVSGLAPGGTATLVIRPGLPWAGWIDHVDPACSRTESSRARCVVTAETTFSFEAVGIGRLILEVTPSEGTDDRDRGNNQTYADLVTFGDDPPDGPEPPTEPPLIALEP